MYSINPLPMNTLITPDEVMRFIPGNSLDPNILSSCIYAAELRFVQPILGPGCYSAFAAQKNVAVTTANIAALQPFFTARNITLAVGCTVNAIDLAAVSPANTLLWNSVLWPFTAECVKFAALPANYAKFTSQGVIKNNPTPSFIDSGSYQISSSSGISLPDLKYLRDSVLLQNISVMRDAVELFLAANAVSYPGIPAEVCHRWAHRRQARKSPLVFIYDDEDDHRRHPGGSCQPLTPAPVPIPQTRACTLIVEIAASPNPATAFTLCNLQTIALQYPPGPTLTIPHLAGLTVNPVIQVDNGTPFLCPYNPAAGTFDNTAGGGFVAGNVVVVNYNEVV